MAYGRRTRKPFPITGPRRPGQVQNPGARLGGPRGRLGAGGRLGTGLNRPLGSRGLGGRPSLPGNRGLGGRTRPGMSSVRPGGNPLGFSGLRKPRRAGSGGARRMRTPGVGNVLTGRNRNRRGY